MLRYSRAVLALLGVVAVLVGWFEYAAADATSGGNNCIGTGKNDSHGNPMWVGCWPNVCVVPAGSWCYPRTIPNVTLYEPGVGFCQIKVCTCGDNTTVGSFDNTFIAGVAVPLCCPHELWHGGSLVKVRCAGPCGSGSCQEVPTGDPGEFRCICM